MLRFWEQKFDEWDVPYGQDKPGKIYREGDRLGRGDPFGSDDEHAEFLAFVYELRHGEL